MVYHWWGEQCDLLPLQNMRTPLIPAIATLRSVNKEIPIHVLDLSEGETSWGTLQSYLNFEVHRIKPSIKHKVKGYRYLSRLYDIWDFVNQQECNSWIYSDTDVFWLKNPLPLSQKMDRFCFNRYNTGFFYFDKTTEAVQRFFDAFTSITNACLYDEHYWYIVRQHSYTNEHHYLPDEAVCSYLYHRFSDWFNLVDRHEHFVLRHLGEDIENKIDVTKIKMLHCNGLMVDNPISRDSMAVKHSRGIATLYFKEFYNNICTSYPDLAERMFSLVEREHFLPKQVSFCSDTLKEILKTKCSEKLYHLTSHLF